MARPINWAVYNLLLKGRELEPVFIVSVDWGGSGTKRWYSSKLVLSSEAASVDPRILSIDAFDSALAISLEETANEVRIKFDDSDGKLKNFHNKYDLHSKPIEIFQWFEGTNYPQDRFSLFQGVINTPVEWDESDRTLTITGMTRLEDREVGFSLESAAIDYEADDAYELFGKNIPECFGTVVFAGNPKDGAVQLDNENKSNNTATLKNSIVLHDFCIPRRSGALRRIANYLDFLALYWAFANGYLRFIGAYDAAEEAKQKSDQAFAQKADYSAQASDHWTTYQAQLKQERASAIVQIIGGENFPTGNITLNIGGYNIPGYFDGKNFRHQWTHPELKHFSSGGLGYTTEEQTKRFPSADGFNAQLAPGGDVLFIATGNVSGDDAGVAEVRSGSRVTLASAEPMRHAVSTTPGSIVKASAKVVTVTGVMSKYPEDIPQDLWKQVTLNFGKTTLTTVETVDSLSKPAAIASNGVAIPTPGYQNKIFVNYVSTVGPNPVDILTYLILKYTKYGIDRESFARTRLLLQNYGMNFCVPSRKNILTLLKEIAWQARCAIYLKDNKFYLSFLPEVPLYNFEFNEENVDVGSISVAYTDTESIITKWTGTYWPVRGENVDPWKCVLRYNIPKYGVQEEETDFYCYNDYHIIQKVMTYWMIRRGHVWKVIKFKGSLDTLAAEVFDGAYLNFEEGYVSDNPVVGIITQANYNPFDFTVDYEVWTGVRAGEMEQTAFAFPAQVSSSLVFPEVKEKNTAGGFNDAGVDDTSQDVPAPKEEPTYDKAETPKVRLRSGGATSYSVSFPENSMFEPGQGPHSLPEGTFTRGPWEQGNSNDQPHGTPSDSDDGSARNEPDGGQSGSGGRPVDDGGATKTNDPEHMNYDEQAVKGYIDLHQTKIHDTQEKTSATLSTFFRAVKNSKLQGSTGASWMDDEGNEDKEFHFKFDSDGGKFGAGTAFLKD